MPQLHSTGVFPRTDAHKGNSIAVLLIHIRLNLEHESGKLLLVWLHFAGLGRACPRRRGEVVNGIEQFGHAKIIDRRTKKYRSQFTSQITVGVKFVRSSPNQFNFLTKFSGHVTEHLVQSRIIETFNNFSRRNPV